MYNIAGVTLAGMYNYFKQIESDLFSDIILYEDIDKDLLIDFIMEQSGELLTIRQIPLRVKSDINNFFKANAFNFEKVYKALQDDYNPLHNFDRHEEYEDIQTFGHEVEMAHTGSNSVTSNGTVTDTHTGNETEITKYEGKETSTNKTSADNSEDFLNESQTETVFGSGGERKDTTTRSKAGVTDTTTTGSTDTTNFNDKEKTTNSGQDKNKHIGHLYGNIGVTKSQEMLKDEMEIRTMNFYQWATDLFEKSICLQIY